MTNQCTSENLKVAIENDIKSKIHTVKSRLIEIESEVEKGYISNARQLMKGLLAGIDNASEVEARAYDWHETQRKNAPPSQVFGAPHD